jgi:hypothetical protein
MHTCHKHDALVSNGDGGELGSGEIGDPRYRRLAPRVAVTLTPKLTQIGGRWPPPDLTVYGVQTQVLEGAPSSLPT